MKLSILVIIFVTSLCVSAKRPKTFLCPKEVILKVKSNLAKGYNLFDENIKLKFDGKFHMYFDHPRTMTLSKPQNSHESGKKPLFWLFSTNEMILACSYRSGGHFEVSNLVLKKIKGPFKKCTGLSDKAGVSCL